MVPVAVPFNMWQFHVIELSFFFSEFTRRIEKKYPPPRSSLHMKIEHTSFQKYRNMHLCVNKPIRIPHLLLIRYLPLCSVFSSESKQQFQAQGTGREGSSICEAKYNCTGRSKYFLCYGWTVKLRIKS